MLNSPTSKHGISLFIYVQFMYSFFLKTIWTTPKTATENGRNKYKTAEECAPVS